MLNLSDFKIKKREYPEVFETFINSFNSLYESDVEDIIVQEDLFQNMEMSLSKVIERYSKQVSAFIKDIKSTSKEQRKAIETYLEKSETTLKEKIKSIKKDDYKNINCEVMLPYEKYKALCSILDKITFKKDGAAKLIKETAFNNPTDKTYSQYLSTIGIKLSAHQDHKLGYKLKLTDNYTNVLKKNTNLKECEFTALNFLLKDIKTILSTLDEKTITTQIANTLEGFKIAEAKAKAILAGKKEATKEELQKIIVAMLKSYLAILLMHTSICVLQKRKYNCLMSIIKGIKDMKVEEVVSEDEEPEDDDIDDDE